ncbi:phosphatidate cytidylyltransferase [Microbacterium kunmingense]|uniref:phosphatidate cytidylyltransferase n=1 Tax=Microbacterium kunmingense TaxID=2915939 RepID=UPI002003EB4F|nr:phosphatidate cytidylyltransferase [Microbacterium kunmingense]
MTDTAGGERGSGAPEVPATRRKAAAARRGMVAGEPGFQTHVRAARSELETQLAHARAEFEEANARITQRTGRNLILAILIGLAIGVVVLASLIFFKQLFVLFALAASTLGTFEFSRALRASGRKVDIVAQLVAGTLLVVAGFFLQPWLHWIGAFAAVALVVVWRRVAQLFADDGRPHRLVLGDVLIAALVQLYVPFLASLCVALLAQDGGQWWVLAFIIVAVVSDTGAYVSGLTLGRGGRHPMAPRISPKKTWEGFAGAAVAAVVAGLLLAPLMLGLPIWTGVIIGLVILGTATAGDLGESMIKRDLGIKDMSSWLPGHGGVLDRLDSILPSTTAALALYYLLSPLGVA